MPKLRKKRKGRIVHLVASAEERKYVGNSAALEDELLARQARERADAWAKAPAGTKYGEEKR